MKDKSLRIQSMHSLCGILLIAFVLPVFAQKLPIQPTRTISFRTTQGSYMDVDLSPDGTQIIFDLLGDIYTLPITGGNAVQLTRGLACNRYPVWSPNGKQVAFMSDVSGAYHLNVMNADGTKMKTLGLFDLQSDMNNPSHYEEMPVWTPDGFNIASEGRLYNLAGGSIFLPLQIKYNIHFSSDGQFLYYSNDSNEGFQCYDRYTGIVTKRAGLPFNCGNARLSPDGHYLVYISKLGMESNLRVRDLVIGEDRLLAASIEKYRTIEERYAFTPDSHSVLIGFGGKLHSIDVQTGADKIIPFAADVNVELGQFNYNTYRITRDSIQAQYIRSANVSPDGSHLVFSALNRLYVMTLPNGIPHLLVNQTDGQYQPIYSPDGKWIAYTTWNDTTGGHLWCVSAVGGHPEQLTRVTGHYEHPTWSPSGKQLAVLKASEINQLHEGSAGFGQLQLISVTGEKTIIVEDSVPMKNHLTFSANGNSLVFEPIQKPMYDPRFPKRIPVLPELISVDISSKNARVLAVSVGAISQLNDITVSPDGRYVVFERCEDIYLSTFPHLDEPVVLDDWGGLGKLPVIRFRIAQGGVDPHWESGGKILSWSYADKFYQVDPDKVVAMSIRIAQDNPQQDTTNLSEGITLSKCVVPDQTITMNVRAARDYTHGIIVLRDARIVSMKGNEVIEHGTIVITDGRFTAVGPLASVHIPFGAKIFEVTGMTIIPGLVDLHCHMREPLGIFAQQWWAYLSNLAYGVTTARDPSSSFDSFGYAELLETGQMIGPRLFTVGRPIETYFNLKSLDDARALVRKRKMFGAITIKQYNLETRLQKQWLLIAANEAGLNMTNEGDYDALGSLSMMKDGSTGVEHNPIWGNVFNDVTLFVAASGSWLTPTLQVRARRESAIPYFHNLNRQHPDPKIARFWSRWAIKYRLPSVAPEDTIHPEFIDLSAVDAVISHRGGRVTVGAHGNDEGIGTHWELWALQMGGLTNLEALQAATIRGAEELGMQQDLGSIEVGKLADLIVLNKNPLDNIQNTLSIHDVMKGGILYDGDTLDEIWPEVKKCPEWKIKNPAQPLDSK